MAWTAPRTWVAAEKPSAATFNTHVRDNLTYLYDIFASQAWTNYTPTWTCLTTGPVLGNGTLTGKYCQIGQTVHFIIELTAGTTTTFGTGNFQFDLPVVEFALRWGFRGMARDNSAPGSFPLLAERTASNLLTVKCDSLTAGSQLRSVTNTVPFTWAVSDSLTIHGEYAAA